MGGSQREHKLKEKWQMDTVKMSWAKLFRCAQVAQLYLRDHKGRTKLKLALERCLTRITKHQAKLQRKLEKIDLKYCATDSEKIILQKEARQADGSITQEYQFTTENKDKRDDEREQLFEKADIVFEPYFVSDLPEPGSEHELTESQLEAFCGIVISEEDVETYRKRQDELLEKPAAVERPAPADEAPSSNHRHSTAVVTN